MNMPMTDTENAIIGMLDHYTPVSDSDIATTIGESKSYILGTLTMLELKGLIKRVAENSYILETKRTQE